MLKGEHTSPKRIVNAAVFRQPPYLVQVGELDLDSLNMLALGLLHATFAQAETFASMPCWRSQWQYWSSMVQLTDAMAPKLQVACAQVRNKLQHFMSVLTTQAGTNPTGGTDCANAVAKI